MLARLRRILRHRWIDESRTRRVLPPEAVQRLAARVAASERRHSGEIRIYVEAGLPLGYLWREATARERAIALFGKLRVWDTENNNGVLLYLLLAEKRIEIVADRGLSQRVDAQEWQRIADAMVGAFRGGDYEQGLVQAVDAVTRLLQQHFPLAPGQASPNELPDEPVLG